MNTVAHNYRELRALAIREARRNLYEFSDEAEDIAQDVLIQLYKRESEGTLDGLKMFGLCKAIAKKRSLTYYAKESRRGQIRRESGKQINKGLTGQSAENLAADPLAIMEYEEMRERLNELSPLVYITAKLYYIEGLSVEAIADLGSVAETVIYKRLQRARDYITNGE